MKPVISLFSLALIASLALSSLGLAQNVTINLESINPPIQIPAPGGSFDYHVTVSNTGASPQTFDAWIMVELPDSTWYGPVLGPVNLTLQTGASLTRQRSQAVPANAPEGNYVFEGRMGIYPNTIWNADSFAFAKTLEGSQEWVARYDGPENDIDYAQSLALDVFGNVYVTGQSYGGETSYDFATIKYNHLGIRQWITRYNGPANSWDEAHDLAIDAMGEIYITGFSYGNGTAKDYATIKYNSAGVLQWVAGYNGSGNNHDEAHSLAVTETGNICVTGSSIGLGTFYDYVTIQYDFLGVQRWEARYNGPENNIDMARVLTIDGAENVYVTGWSSGFEYYLDYTTIKYDPNGIQQWVERYDGPGNADDYATALAVDHEGNVVVTGYSSGLTTVFDYATVKYDSTGFELWVARYDGSNHGNDEARALAIDSLGNVYVTGNSWCNATWYDFITIKYNSVGVQQWIARYNGPGNESDYAYALAVDCYGNVYVTGASSSIGGSCDYATIKYNSEGQQQWVMQYDGPANWEDKALHLALSQFGDVYVTGYSEGTRTQFDYCTIKYSGGAIANWQPVEALVFGAQEPVTEYQLQPCYPNPFNATTAISYKLQASSHVSLKVYDTAGRLAETLVDGWREAGTHELTFEAGDLSSGVYFCRMQARKGAYAPGDFSTVQKLVLLK